MGKDPPPKPGLIYAVFCEQTGEIYENAQKAADDLSLPRQAIYNYAIGKRKAPVFGYTFEFAYDQTGNNRGRKLIR